VIHKKTTLIGVNHGRGPPKFQASMPQKLNRIEAKPSAAINYHQCTPDRILVVSQQQQVIKQQQSIWQQPK